METNEGTHTCYNGENMEEWTRVVQAINAIHIEVFPNILTKDNNQAWLGVEGDFPRREYEQGILVNGILGFQWNLVCNLKLQTALYFFTAAF